MSLPRFPQFLFRVFGLWFGIVATGILLYATYYRTPYLFESNWTIFYVEVFLGVNVILSLGLQLVKEILGVAK